VSPSNNRRRIAACGLPIAERDCNKRRPIPENISSLSADDLAWQLLGLAVGESENGLAVKKVRPGSPAARIGIERGDAIVGLSGTQTRTLAEFRRKIIDARLSQSLLVSIARGRQLYNMTIPPDQG